MRFAPGSGLSTEGKLENRQEEQPMDGVAVAARINQDGTLGALAEGAGGRTHAREAPRRRGRAAAGRIPAMATRTAAMDEPALLRAPSPRALARRAALPAAVAAAVAIAVVVAGGPLHAFADALKRALAADARWVAAGAAFELLSFTGYVALLWMVGSRVSPRLGLRASAEITFGGAAATRLLPTGGAGGAALTVWALRSAALGTAGAARTLLTFLSVLYGVFLIAILSAGAYLAATGGPLALSAVPATGAGLALAAGLWLGARAPREGSGGPLPARLRTSARVMGEAVRAALAHLRTGDPRLLGALAWWAFDAAVLWSMLHAFGAPPALPVLVLGYLVGQLANTLPLPGAASGGMVGVLLAFGVAPDLALVSVLAYRAVAIWLPAPAGLVALRGLRRTMATWRAQDALTG
jgi:uncharacterized membrane protein YbhN (UPF0104 family)